MLRTPESLEKFLAEDELKLYRLIWMRFIASQMMPALFDQTTIDVNATGKSKAPLYFPRHRQRPEVRRLSARSTKKAKTRRTKTTRS